MTHPGTFDRIMPLDEWQEIFPRIFVGCLNAHIWLKFDITASTWIITVQVQDSFWWICFWMQIFNWNEWSFLWDKFSILDNPLKNIQILILLLPLAIFIVYCLLSLDLLKLNSYMDSCSFTWPVCNTHGMFVWKYISNEKKEEILERKWNLTKFLDFFFIIAV
jgi:hypothetical protein